jgi:hypothetical protein
MPRVLDGRYQMRAAPMLQIRRDASARATTPVVREPSSITVGPRSVIAPPSRAPFVIPIARVSNVGGVFILGTVLTLHS